MKNTRPGFWKVIREIFRPENLGGLTCFGSAGRRIAMRRRFAVGHVHQYDVVPLLGQPRNRAAHAEFLIVRMRSNN